MENKCIYIVFIFILLIVGNAFAQNTYYSTGNGSFSAIATWNTDPDFSLGIPVIGHSGSGDNTYIIQDGDIVTIDTDINVKEIVVGEGSSGQLIVGDNTPAHNVIINGDLEIRSGAMVEIQSNSNLSVKGEWVSNGTFAPGTSQVTLNPDNDFSLGGSITFYSLNINSSSSSTRFTTTGSLDIDNNLNIISGTLIVGDPSHTITVGNDLNVDATSGNIECGTGTFVLDGVDQNIGVASEVLHNLSLQGSGTKTLSSDLLLNGDLTIASSVTLNIGLQDINLSGSFTNNGILNGGGGSFVLEAVSPQIIEGSGITTFNDLSINNTSSGQFDIILRSDITINGNLTLTEGIIDAESDNELVSFTTTGTVTGASTSSFISGPIQKSFPPLSITDFTYPVGEDSIFAAFGINHPAEPGTYTVQYFAQSAPDRFNLDTNNPDGLDDGTEPDMKVVSDKEYWDLSRDAGNSAPIVTLHWEDNERSKFNDADQLVVAHYEGGAWVDKGRGSTTGIVSGSGSITSAESFIFNGPTTFGSNDSEGSPLPVELLSFGADIVGNSVELNWVTAWEKDNDFFLVERSTDTKEFSIVDTLEGAGDSQAELNYAYLDAKPYCGTAYYRLRQVDYNGDYSHSSIITITYDKEEFSVNVSPNPIWSGNTVLNVKGIGQYSHLMATLVNYSGSVVRTFPLQGDASGNVRQTITNLNGLLSGVYTMIIASDQIRGTVRLMIP